MAKALLKKKSVVEKAKPQKEKKQKKAKELSVDSIVGELSKDFDIETMSENSKDMTPYYIPFRHKGLQAATGGLPGGRFTEILGDSQCGKSYLLYEAIAECLEMEGYALLHDVERAYEPRYGKRVGIDGNKKFGLSKEKELEKVFLLSRKFVTRIRAVNKTCPILIGVDSYPPLQTLLSQKETDEQLKKGGAKELKGYREAKKNALFSSLISEFITFIDKHNVTFVLLNQTRKQIGVMFGDPTTSNADNIIRFYVTLRLRGRLGEKIKEQISGKKKQIGVISTWETIKNRKVYPFKKVETKILYKTGISSYSGLTDLLISESVIKHAKKGTKQGFKYNNVFFPTIKDLIKKHPESLLLE